MELEIMGVEEEQKKKREEEVGEAAYLAHGLDGNSLILFGEAGSHACLIIPGCGHPGFQSTVGFSGYSHHCRVMRSHACVGVFLVSSWA